MFEALSCNESWPALTGNWQHPRFRQSEHVHVSTEDMLAHSGDRGTDLYPDRASIQGMNQRTDDMDDRFDRRELLLHLGDILEASSRLAEGGALDAMVSQRVREDASLREFSFLSTLAPTMTVRGFIAGAASAFFQWPRALLAMELNQDVLASAVQHNLFAGNPDGWNAYIANIQEKVQWFGIGSIEVQGASLTEPMSGATDETAPVELKSKGVSSEQQDLCNEKKGWPWPEPRSTS